MEAGKSGETLGMPLELCFPVKKWGKKIIGVGWENFGGGLLKREISPGLGMLFLMDLDILGIAVFGIETRIPGNEFKPHNKGENPKHFPLSSVDSHPGIFPCFCVWKRQIPGFIWSRWILTLPLPPLQIKDFSL